MIEPLCKPVTGCINDHFAFRLLSSLLETYKQIKPMLRTKQNGINANKGMIIVQKNKYALITNISQLVIRRKLERKSFILISFRKKDHIDFICRCTVLEVICLQKNSTIILRGTDYEKWYFLCRKTESQNQ